jgi:hypothetical protein
MFFLPIDQPDTMVLGVSPYIFAYSTEDYDRLGGVDVQTRNDTQQPDHQVGRWLSQNVAVYRFARILNAAFFQSRDETVKSDATGFLPSDASILDGAPWLNVITPSGDGNSRLEMNLALVKHLRDTLAGRGIRLVIINFPLSDKLVETYPGGVKNFDEYLARMAEFADVEQIAFCDLDRPFVSQYPDREAYFQDYYHLNSLGAEAVAPFIATFLAQNLESSVPISNQCGVIGS